MKPANREDRLSRRVEDYDATAKRPGFDASAFHRPGSLTKPYPKGQSKHQSAQKTRHGGGRRK